jgi:hypothetical protein
MAGALTSAHMLYLESRTRLFVLCHGRAWHRCPPAGLFINHPSIIKCDARPPLRPASGAFLRSIGKVTGLMFVISALGVTGFAIMASRPATRLPTFAAGCDGPLTIIGEVAGTMLAAGVTGT